MNAARNHPGMAFISVSDDHIIHRAVQTEPPAPLRDGRQTTPF